MRARSGRRQAGAASAPGPFPGPRSPQRAATPPRDRIAVAGREGEPWLLLGLERRVGERAGPRALTASGFPYSWRMAEDGRQRGRA